MNTNFCSECGNPVNPNALFCSHCGAKTEIKTIRSETFTKSGSSLQVSPKSATVALTLCFLLGMFGFHRFYVGRKSTGFLMFITLGFLGIWLVVDLMFIVQNKFKDKRGRPLILTEPLPAAKEMALVAGTVIAWFLTLIAALTALFLYASSGLVQVVSQQLTTLQTGNIAQAYAYTSTQYQKIISLQNFTIFVNQFPALKNNKNYHFPERKILNNYGYLSGTLTGQDNTTLPIKYQLIKEYGQWKILNITPGQPNK